MLLNTNLNGEIFTIAQWNPVLQDKFQLEDKIVTTQRPDLQVESESTFIDINLCAHALHICQ